MSGGRRSGGPAGVAGPTGVDRWSSPTGADPTAHREHPRPPSPQPGAAGCRRGRARRPAQRRRRPGGPPRRPWPGAGPVSDTLGLRDLPAQVPLLADALAACERHGGQRRDQERARRARLRPRRRAGRRGGRRASSRPAGPSGSSSSSFDLPTVRRRPPGQRRASRLGWLLGPAADPLRAAQAGAGAGLSRRSTPSSPGRRGPGRTGARRPGWPSTSGRSTPDDDLRAMVDLGVDAVITDRLGEALAARSVTGHSRGDRGSEWRSGARVVNNAGP